MLIRLLALLLVLAGPAHAADTWPMGRYGGVPSVAGCGSGGAVSGFDSGGVITLGSGAITACVLTFSTTYSPALRCIVGINGLAVAPNLGITTTALTVTAVLTGGVSVVYHCVTP